MAMTAHATGRSTPATQKSRHSFPLATAEVAKLLEIPEHTIRYRLRARTVREHLAPVARHGRYEWTAAAVAELLRAIESAGICRRERLAPQLLDELDAALEAADAEVAT